MKPTIPEIVGLLLVLMSLGCLKSTPETEHTIPPTTLAATTTLLDDALLLGIAAESSEVKEFVSENPDYEHKITVLTPENTKALAEKYPVVYGGLPEKTLYRIDYTHGSRGLFVIVDLENGKVLKYFRSVGVNLS